MTENKLSSRNFRRKYPGSPEQFYSSNKIVSGSRVVKEIPAGGRYDGDKVPAQTFLSYRKIRSIYPVSPEQFYSLNRSVSGGRVVREIPAQRPV